MIKETAEELKCRKELVRIRRDSLEDGDDDGVIVAVSDNYVLISVVSTDMLFDGFAVIELSDITFMRWGTGALKARRRALDQCGPVPMPKGSVNLESWETIIDSVAKISETITFHRERVNSDVVYVGQGASVDTGIIVADDVSTEGTIDGQFMIRLEDLTRVDFCGHYEEGLLRVLRADSSTRQQN